MVIAAAAGIPEFFPAVGRNAQSARNREDLLRIARIAAHLREIKRPEVDLLTGVTQLPVASAVGAPVEHPVLDRHERVNDPRVAVADADSHAVDRAFRQTVVEALVGKFRPRLSSVDRFVEPASRSAAAHRPRLPQEIEGARKNDVAVLRIESEVTAPSCRVDIDDALPMQTAVVAAVDPALAARGKFAADCRRQYDLAVLRIDGDLRDAAAAGESGVAPMARAVGGKPNAVAVSGRVARKTFARADQDAPPVARIDRDRADCRRMSRFENRRERKSAVLRLPQTAGRVRQIDDRRISGNARDRVETPAHHGRAEPTVCQVAKLRAGSSRACKGARKKKCC